jgi:tRNA pseudouridine55 synthase
MATGVLALVVGRATRLAQFLSAAEKVYEAEVRLGWATDTYDAQGQPIDITGLKPSATTGGSFPWPESEHLDDLLDRFRGRYEQIPPPFSAKKIEGVRSYSLARKGVPTHAKGAPVTVYDVACLGRAGDRIRVRLRCSAGFYVRTFAHDLGMALGVGAHLSALRRTRSGDFDVADAVPLEVVEHEGPAAAARMVPLARLLPAIPAVVVTPAGAVRTRHGNLLRREDLASVPDGSPRCVRVFDEMGALLAIAEPSAMPGFLHPSIVVG